MTALTDRPSWKLDESVPFVWAGSSTGAYHEVESWRPKNPSDLSIVTGQGELITIREIPNPEPIWLRPVARRLASLLDLEPGWNSYGASKIEPRAVVAALRLLGETMSNDVPVPSVVPSSRGGVQLEWHERDVELEVLIGPVGGFAVYFEDLQTGTVKETEMDSDSGVVAEALRLLAQRTE